MNIEYVCLLPASAETVLQIFMNYISKDSFYISKGPISTIGYVKLSKTTQNSKITEKL